MREVKRAYRTLVRQYHPDINPDSAAVERFIKINDAYTILSESLQVKESKLSKVAIHAQEPTQDTVEEETSGRQADTFTDTEASETPFADINTDGLHNRLHDLRLKLEKLGFDTFEDEFSDEAATAVDVSSRASAREEDLKRRTYHQLKELLKQQKFPRAIALIEGLAHRMPQDAEITQWQAITYQRWGRRLIQEGQTHKARIYLKKALRTDPKNRALWREVNRDFWQLRV